MNHRAKSPLILLPTLATLAVLWACAELPVEPTTMVEDPAPQAVVEATESDNGVGVQLGHITLYGTNRDLIPNSPVRMQDHYFWHVQNHPDETGASMVLTRVTAASDLAIAWTDGEPGPPGIRVWNDDQVLPEGWGASAGGNVDPPVMMTPIATMTRDVWPTRLEGPETVQTVRIAITFLSSLEPGVNPGVAIGTPMDIGVEDLVTSEIILQHPVEGWDIVYSGPQVARWGTTSDRVATGVPYEFVVELRSVKSPSLIGTPRWKSQADMSAGIVLSDGPSQVGTAVSLSHPDGLDVTVESQDAVDWHPTSTRGTELHFWPRTSQVESCGDGLWCVVPETFRIPIDIKPGGPGEPASINPKSKGKIPVAILFSTDLDPLTELVPESLTFGRTGWEESLSHCAWNGEDIDGDGHLDVVCQFDTPAAGFEPGDGVGWLVGESIHGDLVWGAEQIRTVGGGKR